ncbi:MAG: OmpA family protein [Methylotenera sp.]|nr:OmpA family protein [Methylotenera sp.]
MKKIITLLLLSLLTACATTRDKVILLPQANGQASAVEVMSNEGNKVVLDQPYQAVKGKSNGKWTANNSVNADFVKSNYSDLINLQPLNEARYILYFKPNTSELTQESSAQLPEIINDASARSGGEISIFGYTDTVGAADGNQALSQQRALIIKNILIKSGFNADLITATGRGELNLAVPTDDEVDEAKNRRVEITVR